MTMTLAELSMKQRNIEEDLDKIVKRVYDKYRRNSRPGHKVNIHVRLHTPVYVNYVCNYVCNDHGTSDPFYYNEEDLDDIVNDLKLSFLLNGYKLADPLFLSPISRSYCFFGEYYDITNRSILFEEKEK